MYVKIGNTSYTEIRNISLDPQVDIIGDTLPVNQLTLEIKTLDEINVGGIIKFYDDMDRLWTKYWITYADRINSEFVQIKAESAITVLDRIILEPTYYDEMEFKFAVYNIISPARTTFALVELFNYIIDDSLKDIEIKGYCPEQTARERLQWLCFVAGAYVSQAFNSTSVITLDGDEYTMYNSLEFKELDTETVDQIPIKQTYWKPSIEYKDFVTKVSMTAYTFTAGTPAQGDDYVEVDGTKYIISETRVSLTNQNVPADAAPNEILLDGLYLVNTGNVDELLSRIALTYFARTEIKADIINNKEFHPPQKVSIMLDDEGSSAVGYIESADFRFGLQSMSSLNIVACELQSLTRLVIWYLYKNAVIRTKRYFFPVGYSYSIENEFINQSDEKHKYIYRPVNEYATGTIESGVNTNNQDVEIALHQYKEDKLLYIISVSDIEWDSEEKELEIG